MKEQKQCALCKQLVSTSEFWRCSSRADGLQNACKACQRAKQQQRAQTPEFKATAKAWLAANPEKKWTNSWKKNAVEGREWHRQYMAAWMTKNPDRWRANARKSSAKQREELSDNYVKHLIRKGCGFSQRLIPAEMVEAKREQLSMQRLLRALKQEIKDKQESANGN